MQEASPHDIDSTGKPVASRSASGCTLRDACIPIVIGVVGHRNLHPDQRDEIRAAVKVFFDSQRDEFPNTPLYLLSALAEGADRLVADIAGEIGIDVVAVLPMDADNYCSDFKTSESLAEFRKALGRTTKTIVVPFAPGVKAANANAPGPERDRQYAAAGAFIARNSHILLALWDGVENQLTGGTAQIVDFYLHGVSQEFSNADPTLDAVKSGPAVHVRVARAGTPDPGHVTVHPIYHKKLRTGQERESFQLALRRLDEFNDDVLHLGDELSGEAGDSEERFVQESTASDLGEHARLMLRQYALADSLAVHFKRKEQRILGGLQVLGTVAALAFIFTTTYLRPILIPLYIAILVVGVVLAEHGRRRLQPKYLDYRALAEGLRIQLVWKLSGIEEPVSDHYLRKQRSELDWIPDALRTIGLLSAAETYGSHMSLVAAKWVSAEVHWFAAKSTHSRKRAVLSRNQFKLLVAGLSAIALIFMTAIVKVNPLGFRSGLHWFVLEVKKEEYPMFEWIRGTIAVTLAIFAFLGIHEWVQNISAVTETKRQYAIMRDIFALAESRILEAIDEGRPERARLLIRELGMESLRENADWVLLHRSRKVEPPLA